MASVGGETYDVDTRTSRPQSLLVTVYGAFARDHDGWLPVSALVSLLAELDVDEQAIRAAVSRLKRRGVLLAERRDGHAGYAISAGTRRLFEVGDARVLDGVGHAPDEGWVLVSFSIPERSRDLRYRLRTRLVRIGAGQVDGGLWIAPRHLRDDIDLVVSELGVREHVSVFTADYHGYDDPASKAAQWWDLEGIHEQYQSFVAAFAPVEARWARARRIDPASAFADYTRALTAWRPLPYADPGLPTALLPSPWAGVRAHQLFQGIRARLAPAATAFVADTLARY